MKKIMLPALFATAAFASSAQRVVPLVQGIMIDSVLLAVPGATKLAHQSVTGHFYYSTIEGEIHEVLVPSSGPASSSLKYTADDHGISALQGMCILDSVMYLSGNVWSSVTGIGKVVKGTLQSDGSRIWADMVTTEPYPTASSGGDHGFTGVAVDPSASFVFVSSGARTHLGEIRTNNGAYPGLREVPLTTLILRFPIETEGVVLLNDAALLENSGYIFASGTRNAYDMAWDGNDALFAIDNSGERDDPEELNWLRLGRHYGYPWTMGGNDNPLRVSPYDADMDPLVNPLSGGYQNGWFGDDPTFPAAPAGVVFTEPVRNYGEAADFFRDPVTGEVQDASDEGTYITSFTAHRSPVGLVFDRDSTLAAPYRGDGFVLSFMPGGDSTGYTPLSPWGSPCPFVDTSRELVHMKLVHNAGIDNYTMTTTSIVGGFYKPIDAVLVGNELFVIEHGGSLWRMTFPVHLGIAEQARTIALSVFPNPFSQLATLQFENPGNGKCRITITNSVGQVVKAMDDITTNSVHLDNGNLASGLYLVKVRGANGAIGSARIVVE